MPPNPQTTAGWDVIAQRETYGADDAGATVRGMEVTFRLKKSGTVSTVFVPKERYNVDNVKAAIMEKVGHLSQVDTLSG